MQLQYKDSGVEWIERLPKRWEVKPAFSVLDEIDERNDKGRVQNVLSLSYGKIVRRDVGSNFGLLPQSFNTYQIVRGGDIVLRLLDLQNDHVSLRVGLVPEEGIVTSAYLSVRPKSGSDSRFAAYLLHAYDIKKVFYSFGGGCRQSMGFEDLRRLPIPFPSTAEQRRIAEYLDKATGKVDRLLALRQRQIELLQEQRAALIQQAVTCGLDPNAPLKDSGLPWLGQIPKHWEVKRIKYVAKVESGHTPSRSVDAYWQNCDIPWVSLNDSGYLRNHDYIEETFYKVSALGIENSSAHILPAHAVVFSRDATVGLCAITTVPMAVAQHFIAYLCRPGLIPEYLLFVLRSMTQELEKLSMGATIRTIGMDDIRNLATPFPSIEEQTAICEYIAKMVPLVDSTISDYTRQLELLEEYRAALIHECVTGQRAVPESFTITNPRN